MGETGHLTLVPEYKEPQSRHLPSPVALTVRWICLLILLASTLLGLPARQPAETDVSRLFQDVHTGSASSVSIEDVAGQTPVNSVRVRWKTSLFSWHQANPWKLPCGSGDQLNLQLEGTTTLLAVPIPQGVNCQDADAVMRGYLQGAAGPRGIPIETYNAQAAAGLHVRFFPVAVGVWGPLAFLTGLLWLSTFLGMLFTRDHPYANRWAWFWLFVIGGVGPLLILFKEPTPLRLRFWKRDPYPHRWTQPPMTGGTGFLLAIGWTVGLAAVGWGLGYMTGKI